MTTQGSQEWLLERLGKVTASRIVDMMASTKSGEAASRANYRAQLVAERLTGTVQESFTNGAMQWGTDNEPVARAMYEVAAGVMVDQVGFIDHPTIRMSGASPDGLIDSDGHVEIKCPNTATHIETLLSGKAPSKYIKQMQWQMACTGRAWCDFVSYDPRMPEHLALFVVRVPRDDSAIKEISDAVALFLVEIDSTIEKLGNIVPASIHSRKVAQPAIAKASAPDVTDTEQDARDAETARQRALEQERFAAAQAPSRMENDMAQEWQDAAQRVVAAAVIEHQAEISAFIASRDFSKDAGIVRAILVEFVKFQAARKVKP